MLNNKKNTLDEQLLDEFVGILNNLSGLKLNITTIMNQIKCAEKKTQKRIKQLKKELNKNKNKGNRKPSGFAVPSKISPELCNFMDVPLGTEIARTEVTKHIIQYIKDNKLQGLTNKKVIRPNAQLEHLLKINKGDEVTYFNIQKYMNQHFEKKKK